MMQSMSFCALPTLMISMPFVATNADGMSNPKIGAFCCELTTIETLEWESTAPIRSYDELLRDVYFFVSQHRGADAEDVAHEFCITMHESITVTEDLLRQGMLDFD